MLARRGIAPLGALLASVLLGGCGEASPKGAESTPPPVPASGTVDVRLTDGKIEPADVTVAKPGEVAVKVRNTGRKTHALRIEGPPPVAMVETTDLRRGDSDTMEAYISRPGKYRWYCPYHRAEGMSGTITVPEP